MKIKGAEEEKKLAPLKWGDEGKLKMLVAL